MSSFIVPPPAPFVINDENVEERFHDYKIKFERFMKANGLDTKEEGQKVAIFKSMCGEDLLLQVEADENDDDTLSDVLQRLQDYYTPSSNKLQEQFKFFIRRQRPHENFDKYLIELKKIAKNCNFGDLEESLIKVALIMNVRDYNEQQKILREADSKKLDTLVPDFRKIDAAKKANPPKKISKGDLGKNKNENQQDGQNKNQQKPNKQPNQNSSQSQTQQSKPNQSSSQPPPQKQKQQPPPQKPKSDGGKKDSQKTNNHNSNSAQGSKEKKGNSNASGDAKHKKKPNKPQNNGQNSDNPIDFLSDLAARVQNMSA